MKVLSVFVVALSLSLVSAQADAQARRAAPGGAAVGHAVPRAVAPHWVAPLHSYYYPYYRYGYAPYPYYRSGFSFGFYAGYPFGYYGYYPYAYPYGYYGYGYPGYVAMAPGAVYGSVRIQGGPRDAQVFADGYYVGVADDFDGALQHLNLTPGAHRIEVRTPNAPAVAFDVRVVPGQTVTYHVN